MKRFLIAPLDISENNREACKGPPFDAKFLGAVEFLSPRPTAKMSQIIITTANPVKHKLLVSVNPGRGIFRLFTRSS